MNTTLLLQDVLSDNELVEKILLGETAFFEVLIRRHNSALYRIGRAYGLNHQDTEDMMQETHYKAYTQLAQFRREASYKTWLAKIMVHHCYHKIHYGSLKWEARNEGETEALQLTETSMDTEKMVANRELSLILEKSLEGLPLIYRSVFMLREVEGFSVAETAALLQISATNVKVRLNRAKAMLQKNLEKFYAAADLYAFHLQYCDAIVAGVFSRIRENLT